VKTLANFALAARTNDRDAQYPPWRISTAGGGREGGRERRGDLLKRAANGEERGEFIPRDFSPYELSAVRATSRASGIEKSSIRRNPLGDDANYRASYRALSRSLRIRSESPADKYAPT
jgi:hypothetical protein